MTVFQIGASLKEARTKRGLTTADVVKELRLRERYLNALEDEHWDQLPAEAYVKGFLRMYAEFLGLNGNLYVDEYNARFANREEEPFVPEPQVPRHERHRSRGVLRTVLAVAVLGAAVAGLAAWQLGGSPAAKTPLPKPVVAHNAAPAAPATPVVPASTKKTQKPSSHARTTFAVIRANARCWVQARSGGPHGALLYQGTLTAGTTKKFSLARRVWVRLGKPLALAITVAGRPVSGLSANPSNLLLTRRGAQSA